MSRRLVLGTSIAFVVLVAGCGSEGISVKQCLSASDTVYHDHLAAEYDEFTDSTLVATGTGLNLLAAELEAATGGSSRLTPRAVLNCQGEGLCRPDSVQMLFYRTGTSRELPDSANTIFLLDEAERVRIGSADVRAEATDYLGKVIVQELASLNLPYDEFVTIACSDSVRFRVGGQEGGLQSDERDRFRYLVAAAERRPPLTEFQRPSDETSTEQERSPSASSTGTESLPSDLTLPNWMTVDEQNETVTIQLVAGQTDANTSWNYNGHHSGNATIVVPQGYKVTLEFENQDQAVAHSVGVDSQVGGYPATFDEVTPVFDGAVTSGATKMASATQPGESETITFTASKAGEYALVCYIPAHATQGGWLRFIVSDEGEVGFGRSG